MTGDVHEDGIHAHHLKRESEPRLLQAIGHQVKTGEEQAAPTATEEHPRRRPDTFDHRRDSSSIEDPSDPQAGQAEQGDSEQPPADRNVLSAQPSAHQQTANHRAQGGNETQRQVATPVVEKRLGPREPIEEPHIEVMGRVGVLVPMGGESAQAVLLHPIGRDTDGGGIELRTGQRCHGEPCPVADENGQQCNHLSPHTPPGQKPQEGVAQTNLGERVLEGEVRLGRMRRAQRDTQR